MSTFIAVGNMKLAFARLLEGVERIAPSLPQPVIAQRGHTPFTSTVMTVVDFLDMNAFEAQVAGARLLIMHAGAGSIIHAIQHGLVPVVMPRRAVYGEHVDEHQLELAEAMASTGRVILAAEPDELIHAIEVALARGAAPASEYAASSHPAAKALSEALHHEAARIRPNLRRSHHR